MFSFGQKRRTTQALYVEELRLAVAEGRRRWGGPGAADIQRLARRERGVDLDIWDIWRAMDGRYYHVVGPK